MGQIEFREACFAVREVRFEYIVARLRAEGTRQAMSVPAVRKLYSE
jgi:hypothetical protein